MIFKSLEPLMSLFGQLRPLVVTLETIYGPVELEISNVSLLRARSRAGTMRVDGVPVAVNISFAFSEAYSAYALLSSSSPIIWREDEAETSSNLAFKVFTAVDEALKGFLKTNPRILAVAEVENLTEKLRKLDVTIESTESTLGALKRSRADLAEEVVSLRRGLMTAVVNASAA